jgi:hypothetical protein
MKKTKEERRGKREERKRVTFFILLLLRAFARAIGRKFFPGISKFGVFWPFLGKKREKFDIFSDNFC